MPPCGEGEDQAAAVSPGGAGPQQLTPGFSDCSGGTGVRTSIINIPEDNPASAKLYLKPFSW